MEIVDPKVDPRLVPEGSRAIVYGINQPEFQPLPAIVTASGCMISRWNPSEEERAAMLRGEDIYVSIWNGGHVHPMFVSIGPIDWTK